MLRAPEAQEHASTPLDSGSELAVPVGLALRESRPRRPPRPVLTGPRSPVHPAPALLRAASSEASKPRGPWLGRGEGSTRARAEGSRATPRGRCRTWESGLGEGCCGTGSFTLSGIGSRGAVTGRPEPLRCSTNRRGTRSRQQAREGGGPEGGAGRQVTLPCPGPAAQAGGGDTRLTLHPARL